MVKGDYLHYPEDKTVVFFVRARHSTAIRRGLGYARFVKLTSKCNRASSANNRVTYKINKQTLPRALS